MSEEIHKIRINHTNLYTRNQSFQRRVKSIADRTLINGWAMAEVSKHLGTDSVQNLNDVINRLADVNTAPLITSVEDLRNWANTRQGCKLGTLVATNVPVICTGFLVNQDEADEICKGLDGYHRPPKHTRWHCCGITFGSVFVKSILGTKPDGSRFTKEVRVHSACNNCLDTFVGTITDGNRRTNKWSFKPYVPKTNHNDRAPSKGKNRPQKPKSSTVHNKALRYILDAVKYQFSAGGRPQDMFYKVTLTMLESYSKSVNTAFKGNKAEQVKQFVSYIETNDEEAHRLVTAKFCVAPQ